MSATTPGFHSGPPVGTVIHKTITVIKLAMWGKKEKAPSPLQSPPKPQDIYRDTYFPMKTKRNVDSSHLDPCLLHCGMWCLILERPADPPRESHACSTRSKRGGHILQTCRLHRRWMAALASGKPLPSMSPPGARGSCPDRATAAGSLLRSQAPF